VKATTKGLLSPRPVVARAIHLVGEEGNRVEEGAVGEVTEPNEVLMDYGDAGWINLIAPAARLMGDASPAPQDWALAQPVFKSPASSG
jgi:hypothetical protein